VRHSAGPPEGEPFRPFGVRGVQERRGDVLLALIVAVGLLAMRAHRLRVLAAAGLVGALLVLVPTRFVSPGWPAALSVVTSTETTFVVASARAKNHRAAPTSRRGD
jgi:hypothetical protein